MTTSHSGETSQYSADSLSDADTPRADQSNENQPSTVQSALFSRAPIQSAHPVMNNSFVETHPAPSRPEIARLANAFAPEVAACSTPYEVKPGKLECLSQCA